MTLFSDCKVNNLLTIHRYIPMAAKVLMELMVRLSSRFKFSSKANTLDAPPPGHDPIAINPNPVTGSIPIISAIARATCNEDDTRMTQTVSA